MLLLFLWKIRIRSTDFKKFLKHNDNKTELFLQTAEKVPEFTRNISITVICTKHLEVALNFKNDLSPFSPATTKQ